MAVLPGSLDAWTTVGTRGEEAAAMNEEMACHPAPNNPVRGSFGKCTGRANQLICSSLFSAEAFVVESQNILRGLDAFSGGYFADNAEF
jgi:hypothetical protein